MSKTIKELSYLLIEMVNGGIPTDDSKINYRVAKAYIKAATGFYLRARYWEEKRNGDDNYVGNSITKKVEVKYDEDSELYYIETFGESIDESMRSYSVSPINPASRWSIKFVPITPQEFFNQSQLKARIPNTIQYYKIGNRISFLNGEVGSNVSLNLTQRNVVPDGDDDQVPSDIETLVLERSYRLAFQEVSIQSDRDNNGVPL